MQREDWTSGYELGTHEEHDFHKALFGMGAAAMEALRTKNEEIFCAYKIMRSAAFCLLQTLEAKHNLPTNNVYRDCFRNVMQEIRGKREQQRLSFKEKLAADPEMAARCETVKNDLEQAFETREQADTDANAATRLEEQPSDIYFTPIKN